MIHSSLKPFVGRQFDDDCLMVKSGMATDQKQDSDIDCIDRIYKEKLPRSLSLESIGSETF